MYRKKGLRKSYIYSHTEKVYIHKKEDKATFFFFGEQ